MYVCFAAIATVEGTRKLSTEVSLRLHNGVSHFASHRARHPITAGGTVQRLRWSLERYGQRGPKQARPAASGADGCMWMIPDIPVLKML